MTFSKDPIGDKGQRYEILAIFPDGVKTIGWAETKEGEIGRASCRERV